jgi:hypothetical protein
MKKEREARREDPWGEGIPLEPRFCILELLPQDRPETGEV